MPPNEPMFSTFLEIRDRMQNISAKCILTFKKPSDAGTDFCVSELLKLDQNFQRNR